MSSKTKVLLVGIDGLILDRAIASGRAKTLQSLKENSFFAEMEVDLPTLSGPSWSTILTGSTYAEHGVRDNHFIGHFLLHRPDLLSRAFYQDQSTTTFAAAGWPPLVHPSNLGPIIHERREQQMAGRHRIIARDGETHGYTVIDAEIAQFAHLAMKEAGPDVSFVHFCEADDMAHVHGSVEGPYFDAIERIDGYLKNLESALVHRNKEHGEKWLLVVVTDHGHRDEGGHGGDSPQERASFVMASGIGRENPSWPSDIKPEHITELILAER